MIRQLRWGHLIGLAIALGLPFLGHTQATIGLCGNPHDNGAAFGPFDYRTATQFQRNIVEGAHFTPSVEMLRKGNTGTIGGDLAYTLNVFPNHPRALHAMTRLASRGKTNQPTGARFLIECYYDRAIRFAPDDAAVRVMYAHFLIEKKRAPEARQHLATAEQYADNPQIAYNLGLTYFELREFDRSLKFAHIAYKAGIAVPGLRSKLMQAGKWRDPE